MYVEVECDLSTTLLRLTGRVSITVLGKADSRRISVDSKVLGREIIYGVRLSIFIPMGHTAVPESLGNVLIL